MVKKKKSEYTLEERVERLRRHHADHERRIGDLQELHDLITVHRPELFRAWPEATKHAKAAVCAEIRNLTDVNAAIVRQLAEYGTHL